MKTSPLTAEEIACIQQGLKVYKFDWMSVWQYIVPHRDPSLLPRQWRIALGTQKSYKLDASKKEKRRLYESKRRMLKAAALESWQAVSDKEVCEDEIAGGENCMDNSDVAYVHQAFLADWRHETSTLTCPERFSTTNREVNLVNDAMPQEDTQNCNGQQIENSVCGKAQPMIGDRAAFPFVSKLRPHFHTSSDLRSGIHGAPSAIKPRNPIFDMTTSSSKYYSRPYRSRQVNSSHLVKLAPDLPPVNLPPSVRVVSQIAFNGYQCGTSKIYPPGGGVAAHRKDDSASQIHAEKFGLVHPTKKSTRLTSKDSVTGSQLESSGIVGGRSVAAEKGTSDLEMHPLLFQATENMPYYPLKFSSGTTSSFGFFSGTQPQLNLSIFHHPHEKNHVDKSSNSKDCTSRSTSFDFFHPLLQKSNVSQLQTSFDATQTESLIYSGMPPIANTSSSLSEKSNELDLDIHLSSTSGKEKSVESRQLKTHDSMGCAVTEINCRTATNSQENGAPCSEQGEKGPIVSSSKLASCAHPHPLIGLTDNISRSVIDDIGDNSHPEIVMEQEELSDSEEDIEEHVEFECEEMADSEGENGSGCEQLIEAHNEEVLTSAVEKVAKDIMGKSSEPKVNSNTQVDDILLMHDTSTLKMGLISEGKDDKSSSAWLSLDSCAADNDVLSKTKHEVGALGEAPCSRNFELSRPSRCCKKSKSCGKAVREERPTIDVVQQLSLGPVVFATPRKPRKHSGKSRSSLNIGLTVESSGHDDNHKDD